MSNEGYVLAYRSKWSHPAFRRPIQAAIWGWMTEMAAWKDTRVRFMGKLLTVERGQLATSERYIAELFDIDRRAIRSLIDTLIAEGMVIRSVSQGITILTICNYNKYQAQARPDAPDIAPGMFQESARGMSHQNVPPHAPRVDPDHVPEEAQISDCEIIDIDGSEINDVPRHAPGDAPVHAALDAPDPAPVARPNKNERKKELKDPTPPSLRSGGVAPQTPSADLFGALVPIGTPTPAADRKPTLIAKDWTLTPELRAAAIELLERHNLPMIDLDLTAEKFFSHWSARAGPKARMTDWKRTWTNWVIRDAENYRPRAGQSAGQKQSPQEALFTSAARVVSRRRNEAGDY